MPTTSLFAVAAALCGAAATVTASAGRGEFPPALHAEERKTLFHSSTPARGAGDPLVWRGDNLLEFLAAFDAGILVERHLPFQS